MENTTELEKQSKNELEEVDFEANEFDEGDLEENCTELNGAQDEIEVKDAQSDANGDNTQSNTDKAESIKDTDEKALFDTAWEVEIEKQKRIQAENKFECLRYLDEKGLPLSLIDVIGEGSLEKMKGAIDSLLQIITARVRDEVKSRLVSVTPPPSKTISPSYADFQKMSLGEMQKIYSTNRMLYNELTQNNKK